MGRIAFVAPAASVAPNATLDAAYVNEADHTKATHDALGLDAATLQGSAAAAFATSGHSHAGASSMRDVFARPVQWGSIHANNAGTAIQGLGPGGSGASSATSGSNAQVSDAEGMALKGTTGVSIGGVSLVDSNSSASISPANLYDLVFKFRVNTAANVRYFFGVTGNAASTELSADTPAATHRIGLTFSTARPDTNWQFVRGANAWTLDDTGIAFATGVYYFRVTWASTSSVTLKLYNSTGTLLVSRTYTTGLPTNSGRIMTGVSTLTTSAASYDHYFAQWTMPAPVVLA